MKLRIKTFGIGLLVFLICLFSVRIIFRIPLLHALHETLEAFFYYNIFDSNAAPSEQVIIIDEEENEYDRNTYAKLITKLDSLGASVIALDVLFSAERDSAQNHKLIEATENASDRVIHAVEFLQESTRKQAVIPERFCTSFSGRHSYDFIRAYDASLPFQDLLDATNSLGHINRTADETLREAQFFSLIIDHGNCLYPSLALQAVAKFLNCRIDILGGDSTQEIFLVDDDSIKHRIPVNVYGQTLINFMPKHDFAAGVFSFERAFQLFEDENRAHIFNDKIILVGNTFDTQEQWPGPRFQSYPGLVVIGSIISQILNDKNIRDGTFEATSLSLILTLSILAILLSLDVRRAKRKTRYLNLLYPASFVIFLILAIVMIQFRVQTPIILPFSMFLISTLLSKKYFDSKRMLIFVSYSGEDAEFASRLAKSLEKFGIELWLFRESLLPGDTWEKETHSALQRSKKFLIIFSDASVLSNYVEFEWRTADNLSKSIIPVLLCEEEKIPNDLRKYQYSDFRNIRNKIDYDAKLEDLAKVLLA